MALNTIVARGASTIYHDAAQDTTAGIIAAPGAGKRIVIDAIIVTTAATNQLISFDHSAGTAFLVLGLAVANTSHSIAKDSLFILPENVALGVTVTAAVALTIVYRIEAGV